MVDIDQVLGGCIAVIVAGMPAMIALLKIRELHIAVNSRMDKFIEATLAQSKEREAASLSESHDRVAGIAHSRDLLVVQNTQLIDHLAELAKRIDDLPTVVAAAVIAEKTEVYDEHQGTTRPDDREDLV